MQITRDHITDAVIDTLNPVQVAHACNAVEEAGAMFASEAAKREWAVETVQKKTSLKEHLARLAVEVALLLIKRKFDHTDKS